MSIQKLLLFLWLCISSIVAFVLGMQYGISRTSPPEIPTLHITLSKTRVEITEMRGAIDLWINGERKQAGEKVEVR